MNARTMKIGLVGAGIVVIAVVAINSVHRQGATPDPKQLEIKTNTAQTAQTAQPASTAR